LTLTDPEPASRLGHRRTADGSGGRGGRTGRGWRTGTIARIAVVAVAAVTVAVVKLTGGHADPPPPAPAAPIQYLGVFEPDAPGTYASVDGFGRAVGRQPNLVLYYRGWGQHFDRAFAQTAASHGATPFVQLNPTRVSLARIAHGAYDAYLTSFARQVAAFGEPVVIGFGHEMNGYWYSWGYTRARPADFIAAWRHIVTLFRGHGASNVRWLWDVNSKSRRTGPVHDWWPGAQYVTWVGVNGYYYLPGQNFANVFRPVIADIRRFTHAPLLIGETAVGPRAGQPKGIHDLFAGARAQHVLGLVWFDRTSHGSVYKQDWRLEGNPAALAAFRGALHGSS
jgi:hypothetical protein